MLHTQIPPGARMNREQLATEVAAALGKKPGEVEDTVVAVFDAILRATMAGHNVAVPNFGTFRVAETSPREGINPQTGERLTIPATRVLRMKPSQTLRQALMRGVVPSTVRKTARTSGA